VISVEDPTLRLSVSQRHRRIVADYKPIPVSDLIESEVNNGYLVGPFDQAPFPSYRVNPVGIAESKYSKKKRLIMDLSALHNKPGKPSLNDLIDKEEFSLSYIRIDDAIQIIRRCGRGAGMCKTDITDAFRLLPLHPSLWHLHGLKWNKKYFFYVKLVFGSRSSPKLFDQLSQAICWILQNNYDVTHILHLLDDFLTIDRPEVDAHRTMSTLLLVFQKLGVPLSSSKTVGPSTVLEYLGVVLDSILMQARLPADKVCRILGIVESFLQRKTCTKHGQVSSVGATCGQSTLPGAMQRDVRLNSAVQLLRLSMVEPRTQATYDTGFKAFVRFL
jgi:hypothetical protein